MKKIRVTLRGKEAYIKDTKEAHKIHAKGYPGVPLPGGGLKLSLVETAYLLLKGSVEVYLKKEKRVLDMGEFLFYSSQAERKFGKSFAAYREIRERGFFVKIEENYLNIFQPDIKKLRKIPYAKLLVFEENEEIDLVEVLKEARRFQRLGILLFAGVVDAEGDVTYFRFSDFREEGSIQMKKLHLSFLQRLKELFSEDKDLTVRFSFYPEKGGCLLSSTHPEHKLEAILHHTLFFGKMVGDALKLGFYEGRYLLEIFKKKLALSSDQIVVAGEDEQEIGELERLYFQLRKKNFLPKTGFKYGSHFRVYKKLEEGHHAEYLVHLLEKKRLPLFTLEAMVRLATSVNKEMVFAFSKDEEFSYLKVVRVVPAPGKVG